MTETASRDLREELLTALSASTDRPRDGIRKHLARPIHLDDGRYLQFEVDPFFFGISSCATEEPILSGEWLDDVLPRDWFERAEAALGGWNEVIAAELCPWFAESWVAVGGPARFTPAFLFFQGYHLELYDLERRFWVSSAEVFRK
jgi:hypothetical protein